MGKILLYYKYVAVQDPQAIAAWQKDLCKSLGLTGRVILATEGINGTVGGSDEATDAYKAAMEAHPLFNEIDFKEAVGDERYFPRMKVMVKREIVGLGIDPETLTVADTGEYLTPQEAHDLMSNPPDDLIILDTRNDYETKIGTFENAIAPNTRYFREFPAYVDNNLDLFKDKQVLMTCTGGVRCERATAYVKTKGVAKKVMHLKGGIHRYIEQFPDGHFRGSNYVFDARISQAANTDILGACSVCSKPSDYYTNCTNALCNKQFLTCQSCKNELQESCGTQCAALIAEKKVVVRTKPARIEDIIKQANVRDELSSSQK